MRHYFYAAFVALGVASSAGATTITQNFDYLGPDQDAALRALGWNGGNAADSFSSNPAGTPANNGGEGAVSSGLGQDGTQGFAFWSQRGVGADGFLFTANAPFLTTDTTSFSWYQRDSRSDPMHVALLVGATWFISNQTFTQPDSTNWVQQMFDVTGSSFFERAMSGDILPGGGTEVGSSLLAAGTQVDAWGFWFDGPKSGTTRIDTITVSGVEVAPIPLPAAAWLLIAGLGGLVAVGHRRKAAA